MIVDIHTVKPRARRLQDGTWFIRCPVYSCLYYGTLDDALKCWRANRLHIQLNFPRWCA